LIGSPEVLEEDYLQEGAQSYMLQMREFGDCIIHHKQPETDGEVGLCALTMIEAMTRSVATGRNVTIHEVLREALL
jgi:predicted dehydrogenase